MPTKYKKMLLSLTFAIALMAPGLALTTQQAYATCDNPSVCTSPKGDTDPEANGSCSDANGCDIVKEYINPAITLVASLVGVVAVMSLILAGIQYSTSGADPQKVAAAKARITKTIGALAFFAFLYGLLQFLVPGGLFNR